MQRQTAQSLGSAPFFHIAAKSRLIAIAAFDVSPKTCGARRRFIFPLSFR
jgi:hypothetical protein